MTTTIHRCAECNHQSADHSEHRASCRVGPCSLGGCACTLTPEQVRALNPAVEVPTFPAFAPRIPVSVIDAWPPRDPQ